MSATNSVALETAAAPRNESEIEMEMGEARDSRRANRANLRALTSLLAEIDVIEEACAGVKGRSDEDSELDDFQRYKLELNRKLSTLKQDLLTKRGIENRVGTNAESIKLKSKIAKALDAAKRTQIQMEAAYRDTERDLDRGLCELSVEEVRSRQELVQLMAQDLLFVQNEFRPSECAEEVGAHGIASMAFNLAHRGQEKRRMQRAASNSASSMTSPRDRALVASAPQPLTAKQQAFIKESIERDLALDAKLSAIKKGVMTLGAIANDINNELDVQQVMLDEVDSKMVNVTDKLETRNHEMKQLLEATGGAGRWCPALVLCIILMACVGYIYNAFLS